MASTTQQFQSTGLYGGAMTVDLAPGFIDASNFREIPDTQEVYVHQEVDDSVVFDLLESVESAAHLDALKEHLHEISRINNDDPESQLVQLYTNTIDLKQTSLKDVDVSKAAITVAIEPAKKWGRTTKLEKEGNEETLEEPILVMILSLIRLANVQTDLLITYNTPITKVKDLNALETVFNGKDKPIASIEELPERIKQGLEAIEVITKTLEVKDWGLFGTDS